MNKPIEIDGDGDDFTIFLFSHPVKEPNTIKLELAPPERGCSYWITYISRIITNIYRWFKIFLWTTKVVK